MRPSRAIVKRNGLFRCLLVMFLTNLPLSLKQKIVSQAMTINSLDMVNTTEMGSISPLVLIALKYFPSVLNGCTLLEQLLQYSLSCHLLQCQ